MSSVATVFDVLAEPTRRRLLDAVRDGERSVGELVEEIGMHQPGISRHLKVLRDAGLVEVRRDAQRRLYRVRPEPLMELDAWLEPYRREWSGRLDALERHLQRTSSPFDPSAVDPQRADPRLADPATTTADPDVADPDVADPALPDPALPDPETADHERSIHARALEPQRKDPT